MRRLIFAAALCLVGTSAFAQIANQTSNSAATESSHVICNSGCAAASGYVTVNSATAGYLLAYNLTAAPSDGALSGVNLPRECIYISGPGTVSFAFSGGDAERYNTGLTLAFSTTGCFTQTLSANAFFKVRRS